VGIEKGSEGTALTRKRGDVTGVYGWGGVGGVVKPGEAVMGGRKSAVGGTEWGGEGAEVEGRREGAVVRGVENAGGSGLENGEGGDGLSGIRKDSAIKSGTKIKKKKR